MTDSLNQNRIIRFDKISFALSFMVVMIHASYTAFYPTTEMMKHIIDDYYSDYISGFAVPGFFILSGIKFFNRFELNQTALKIKKRFQSLVLPYLAWNLISVIWAIIISYMPVISSLIAKREQFIFSYDNLLGGLLWYKYIHPFWFLALLIIFTLLCPLVFYVIRNEYVGIAVIVCLYIIHISVRFPDTSWPMIPIDTVLYSLLFYLIGGVIGRFHMKRIKEDSTKVQSMIACFEFVLAVFLRSTEIHSLFVPAILLGFHSIWVLARMIKVPNWWLSTTFFIYPTHTFVLPVINKLLYFVLPQSSFMALVNTVLGTMVSFLICIYLAKTYELIVHRNKNRLLNGNRRINI